MDSTSESTTMTHLVWVQRDVLRGCAPARCMVSSLLLSWRGAASRKLLLGQRSWSGHKCKVLLHLAPAPWCPVLENPWAVDRKQGLKCVEPGAHLWKILPNYMISM